MRMTPDTNHPRASGLMSKPLNGHRRREASQTCSDWLTTAKQLPGLLRLAAGVAIVIAVIGQFVYSAERGPINFFNFSGYFTTQSNIIPMVTFFASAYFIISRKTQ